MRDRIIKLVQIWQAHLIVALMVGLVVGTAVGAGEGIMVLQTQGLFGRYNELIAWAIAFDAPAVIAAELVLALISGLLFSIIRVVPLKRHLVGLQLGETVLAMSLAYSVWSQGNTDPSIFARNMIGGLLWPAAIGLFAGELVLVASIWISDRAPFVRNLRARYWLLFEAAVVVIAVAFGFSH